MPIHECTLPGGSKGWKWGGEGRCYPDRADAEKQAEAAYANGYAGDEQPTGAGIIFREPGGTVLLLQRSDAASDFAGRWCWPGGGIEEGEAPEQAARREAHEEAGIDFTGPLIPVETRDGFATFLADVSGHFAPELNDEHTAALWVAPESIGDDAQVHPGVTATLRDCMSKITGRSLGAADEAFALDRATVRSYDQDGRMRVAVSNISRAAVNPYLGREIPDWEQLGLNPDRTYKLYRDPEELAKAASSFNNLPLLSRHVPVSADNHQPDLVVGSTGDSAVFDAPFLRNSLVIWARDAIDGVESEAKKELSSAYRYRADMTPGKTPDGEAYDGVMRDIVGNHVSLVKEGRAGPDVVVGDAKPSSNIGAFDMTKSAVLTRKAVFVQGALVAALAPRLAQDAKVDLSPLFAGVTAKNLKDKTPAIIAGLKERTSGKLAQDATIDDLATMLDVLEKAEVAEGADIDPNSGLPVAAIEEKAADADAEQIKAFLAGKLSEDDLAKVLAMLGGGDKAMDKDDDPEGAEDEDEEDKDVVTKTAMDAAIKAAVAKANSDAARNQREIRDAERAVRPYVGELAMAHDSADAVYKTALTAIGVNIDNVHPSAFPAILAAQPKPGAKPAQTARVAMDSASSASFATMFPGADKIGHA